MSNYTYRTSHVIHSGDVSSNCGILAAANRRYRKANPDHPTEIVLAWVDSHIHPSTADVTCIRCLDALYKRANRDRTHFTDHRRRFSRYTNWRR